jgi:methyl-accepting chemotaxis protein
VWNEAIIQLTLNHFLIANGEKVMSETANSEEIVTHKQKKNRPIGYLLIFTAIFGWLLSIGWIAGLWYVRPIVRSTLIDGVDTLSISLDASEQMLIVVNDSITQADASLTQVTSMLSEFSLVLDTTSEVMLTVSDILEDDLTQVLNGTVQGLRGLEQTMLLVDNTLILVSSIPFFGGERYRPATPLNQSVAQIRLDLSGMPDSIGQISTQLNLTAENMQPIPETLSQLSSELTAVQNTLNNADQVITDYELVINDTQTRITELRQNLPSFIDGTFIAITLLATWIALAQIGLFTQGIERLRD